MRIPLNAHQVFYLHRAIVRNASEIVAAEIHQHHVFCDLFFIRSQIFTQHPIFCLSRAAFSCTRNRTIVESLAVTTHEHFRRSAHYSLVAKSQKEHIRRRIYRTQCSIDLQRLAIERRGKSLRKHHLVTITSGDVVLHLSHAFFESTPRPV